MKITTKDIALTESMKVDVEEKANHLQHLFPDLANGHFHIIYHASYEEFECEIHASNHDEVFFAKEKGKEFLPTLTHVTKALQHQLEKQKTKHSIKHENHGLQG
ncbi:hypothetical protein VIN01S_03830 [Vibrio inusitatus NBRC 102082]|uniref:Ribosomal subunit interface protein n=1 Tax=Vibrio inusitatus NBRC 102082 TaxID=1219070 RepID=A0A4Y3HR02_9VIBR|nr:HPF/RaiA family ribosome-associated protein [Vibrio inusitatus]GEA49579.1 hypothetical protein VIN01S_03830 [Vibrio inusitatus NBRC 102082]